MDRFLGWENRRRYLRGGLTLGLLGVLLTGCGEGQNAGLPLPHQTQAIAHVIAVTTQGAQPGMAVKVEGANGGSGSQLGSESAVSGTVVKIRGQVEAIAPLLSGTLYRLKDDSGSIWVRSPQQNLTLGDTLVIEGTSHYEMVQIGPQRLGEVYVEEAQRLQGW